MINIIGVVVAVVVSFAWYLPVIKAQGKNRTLKAKDYIFVGLLIGLLHTCGLIIISELAFDRIFGVPQENELLKEILIDFLRAALIEEFFKFTGFLIAKKSRKPQRKIDYIMLAGLIGLTYNILEKAVVGSLFAVIGGVLFPLHIMWQYNQGGHYYEFEQAKAAGDKKRATKEILMALLVPFFLHGLWDSLLSIIAHGFRPDSSTAFEIVAAVLLALLLAGGIIYTVKTMKKVIKTAHEARDAAIVVGTE